MGTQGETKDGDSSDKMQDVTMAMGCLDCPVCYDPLRPPIFQCAIGHVICSTCCARLSKCPLCSRAAFDRCFCMERVVESVAVPCFYAKNGCTKKIAYFNKRKHESSCRHGPCFCPDSSCCFTGPVAALVDHFTTHHKWPSTAFKYYQQLDLPVKAGPHVLHAQDGNVFLMNMTPAEPFGHTISLVCVQPDPTDSRFGCSVVFSCFTGHHQISTLDSVRSSSLSEGLPKDFFCIVPHASGGRDGVVLRTTIDSELVLDVDDELEDEDDDDESYNEDEDDKANDSDDD